MTKDRKIKNKTGGKDYIYIHIPKINLCFGYYSLRKTLLFYQKIS